MISFLKKQEEKPDYSKEIVFKLYTFNPNLLIDYYNAFVEMGAVVENISGISDYYSDFDKVVNDINEIKKGLVISIKDAYSIHMGQNKHNSQELFYFSYYFDYDANTVEYIDTLLVTQKDVYYAYLTNYYDSKWQNEESIDTYKINKRSLKGLEFGLDLWDNKCVDISKHYGRSIFKDSVLYIAGYCSWFGDIINRKKLKEKLDFVLLAGYCENGLLRVQLFNDINDDYSKHREKQRRMLELLNLLE
jgi:hypothetical protein